MHDNNRRRTVFGVDVRESRLLEALGQRASPRAPPPTAGSASARGRGHHQRQGGGTATLTLPSTLGWRAAARGLEGGGLAPLGRACLLICARSDANRAQHQQRNELITHHDSSAFLII